MSKPLDQEVLLDLNTNATSKRDGILLQLLNLLENLQMHNSEKMIRISGELTEILANKRNCSKLYKAKNLEELLHILLQINQSKMLKIYGNDYLKEKFPVLAKNNFL